MDFKFKPAEISDVVLIQQLAITIWKNHYPGILSGEQIDYMLEKMYAPHVIKCEIEKGYCWTLIYSENQPIGYIEYHPEDNGKKVKLSKIYILPQYHGKGYGQASLKYVIQQSKQLKADSLYLTVNKSNHKAINAYRKAGLEIEETLITEIGSGYVMDDYIMSVLLHEEDFGL